MTTRRHYICIVLLILFVVPISVHAAPDMVPTLNGMESLSELGITRLTLDFNKLPTYELKTSGQRIDLRLNGTATGAGIKRLPEDDKIIKVLIARDTQGVVVSFLLRRLPSNVLATPDAHLHQLKLAIRWEDEDRVRPGIVFDLPDMPAIRKTGAELKRTSIAPSPYRENWLAFIKKTHTPIRCDVAPIYTFPLLPWPENLESENHESLPEWIGLAKEKEWQKLEISTAGLTSTEARLLNIEARVRQGRHKTALGDLRILKRGGIVRQLRPRLRYLLAQIQVRQGLYFEALLNLTEICAILEVPPAWRELALLFTAEIELNLGHPDKAEKALDKLGAPSNDDLARIAELRRMDILALSNEYKKALAGYAGLPVELIDRHPFSLAMTALSCQKTGDFSKARESFNLLGKHRIDAKSKALTRFGELACYENLQDILVFFDELQTIRWDEPKAEVAYRIVMKLTDMMVPAKSDAAARRHLANYRLVSEEADLKELRQEAAIKLAALQHLQGDDSAAISQLEQTLRNYSGGPLRSEAIALLGEILPPAINNFIVQGRNIDALVLVERNRDLLIQQPLTWDFLFQVAKAFDRLELDDRADKIFLYLYDRADTKARKAQACLLLANNYLQLSEFSLAKEYASRYRHFQPGGPDYSQSIEIELRARVALNNAEKGLNWLQQVKPPNSSTFILYVTDLNWQLQRYQTVIDLLAGYDRATDKLPAPVALKEAEAFYRIGQLDTSLKHYRALFDIEQVANQARYRAGSILLEGRDLPAGQALLEEIAQQETPDRWSKLAADSLRGLTM